MSDLAKQSKRKQWRRERAHLRVRSRVAGTSERPRLSVFKSLRYVYAQLIDDRQGVTVAAASSLEPALKSQLSGGTGNAAAAKLVGATLAERPCLTVQFPVEPFDQGADPGDGMPDPRVKAVGIAERRLGGRRPTPLEEVWLSGV